MVKLKRMFWKEG